MDTHDIIGDKRAFLFWAYLTPLQYKDRLAILDTRVSDPGDDPSWVQFIRGYYGPTFNERSWIAPYVHNWKEHNALLQDLHKTPSPSSSEVIEGVRRVDSFEGLVELVGQNRPMTILYQGKTTLVGRPVSGEGSTPFIEGAAQVSDKLLISTDNGRFSEAVAARLWNHLYCDGKPILLATSDSTTDLCALWRIESPRDTSKEAGGKNHIHP